MQPTCPEYLKQTRWPKEETASLNYFYQQGWVYEFPGWLALSRLVNDVHNNGRTANECEAEYARYCNALRDRRNKNLLK